MSPRHGQGPGRFRHRPGVVEHVLDGGADLVDGYGHHGVDAGTGDFERLPADLRHRHAVGEEVERIVRQAHPPARLERRRQACGTFRLHPDDAGARPQVLHIGRNSGDQAAAAHGHEYGVRTGMLVHDLHAHRALTGNDVHIVVGVYPYISAPVRQLRRVFRRMLVGVAVQHHARPEIAHRIDLDARGVPPHHDVGLDAELARRERHALGMVARGCGDDTPGPVRVGKLRHPVVGPAQLERVDRLQVLPLQSHPVAETGRDVAGVLQRGLNRDIVDTRGENLLDVVFQFSHETAERKYFLIAGQRVTNASGPRPPDAGISATGSSC